MVFFKSEIERFEQMGEKTGWSYIFIPAVIALQIKPYNKKSFRVKGKIDDLEVSGLALLPMGDGDFILALKTELRKKLKKEAGAKVNLEFEEDTTFKIEMPEDLEVCLSQEEHLMQNFLKQPKSHQNYFINWINQAKTEMTRTKRLTMTVNAMDKQMNYGQMMRESKSKV